MKLITFTEVKKKKPLKQAAPKKLAKIAPLKF